MVCRFEINTDIRISCFCCLCVGLFDCVCVGLYVRIYITGTCLSFFPLPLFSSNVCSPKTLFSPLTIPCSSSALVRSFVCLFYFTICPRTTNVSYETFIFYNWKLTEEKYYKIFSKIQVFRRSLFAIIVCINNCLLVPLFL